jgi:HSP20 family protein
MIRTLVSPINTMHQMADFMDRAFSQMWPDEVGFGSLPASTYSLPLDVWEKDNRYFVRAALPGVKPEDLDIEIKDGTLSLSGETKHEFEQDKDSKFWRREYSYGKFHRTLRLPDNIKAEDVQATFENGYVTVTIPMVPGEHKSIKVPVKASDQKSTPALESSGKQSQS